MNQDEEHLRLLSVFHYVVGGLAALFACFPIIHLVIGVFLVVAPPRGPGGAAPAAFVGWLFILFASAFILCGWTLAGCIIAAGRFLSQRRRYLFCLVLAGVECIFMPFGTVLGVFTILVLQREAVKQMFAARQAAEASS